MGKEHRLLQFFEYAHLQDNAMRDTSKAVAELAKRMDSELPDGAEKTAGLRKLLEAKDCFVRAHLEQ